MNCQDFREIIDSYLCDELLTETNHEVLRHLEACANCRGVIESRRILRAKIKSAVQNSPQFQMRDEFYNNLCIQLKRATVVTETAKNPFWTRNTSWMAFAASLIFAFGLGFWFFQTQPNFPPTDIVQTDKKVQKTLLADFAVGDHQNCAVKYNLAEEPVDIDLASAQYANLRQGILVPLQNSAQKYEFLESHTCKYAGHDFTHIVFRHQGRTVSVLLTDLQNYPALKNDELAEIVSNNYQIARFDMQNKAVFVVSDLSEQENSATAKILENPLKRQFAASEQVGTASFKKVNYSVIQTKFTSR